MGKIYNNITELIGHTPVVELHRIEEKEGLAGRIFAKLEFFNPTGSVKDRIALNMIEAAEKSGQLKPGGTVIEGTSGNTGIGLAAIATAKGYAAKIAMPENVSEERRKILNAFGAEYYLTPTELNMAGAGAKAQELLAQTDNSVVIGQGGNPANPGAHYNTTGPEIWDDFDGDIDILVAAVGTGGTITGTGEYLRGKNPDLQIIAVEPAKCPVLSGGEPGIHKIQGIGGGAIAPVTKTELFNEVITVSDEDAYEYARYIAKTEGILVGISAGAVLSAAIKVAKRPENADKKIVFIVPDGGENYLSTPDLF